VTESVSQVTFSLDAKENVTTSGNITLSGLANGNHNITVYAMDKAGNTASQTIYFTIAEPFPTATVAAVSGTVVAVACIGLLLYYRKRSRGLNL
jgi:hypothetical protein